MGYTSSGRKHGRKVLSKSKKNMCTTDISHVNSDKADILNTSNTDNVIEIWEFPLISVQNVSSFNALITLQKVIDKNSSVSINDEIRDQNNTSEEIHLIKIQQE